MKKVGNDYWIYNGCDVYLSKHLMLSEKYEIYKGCDFIEMAHSLKEAKQIIADKFGKLSGGNRKGSGAKPRYSEPTKVVSFRCPMSKEGELKSLISAKLAEWAV